jgi:hypothetical protein
MIDPITAQSSGGPGYCPVPASATGGPQVDMPLFTEPLQASPAVQAIWPVPWQHGCPMAPHARQASITQRLPAWQAAPSLQQGWPTPPQVAQLPARPMSSLRPPQPRPA